MRFRKQEKEAYLNVLKQLSSHSLEEVRREEVSPFNHPHDSCSPHEREREGGHELNNSVIQNWSMSYFVTDQSHCLDGQCWLHAFHQWCM